MPSRRPRDPLKTLSSGTFASPVYRSTFGLGSWTANTTVTPAARFIADRKLIIREIWFSTSAIPSDPDGTMLVNAINFDINEGAGTDDTIVASHDTETVHLVANKGYRAALAAETTENQNTMEEGDVLRFTLVNNSAAISTNAEVTAHIVWQPVKAL